MEVFEGHRALARPLEAPAVAIGNFDGVHRGHRALLEAAVTWAAERGSESVALTFEPHPARVLAPALAPRLITPLARKLELIGGAGVAVTVVEPFTVELAALSPETFVADVLVGALGAAHVVVGYDFTFGHKRAGTVVTLADLGERHGFSVQIIKPVEVEGIVASSTKVRNFVGDGNLAGAELLLGRRYDVEGPVVRGAKRGRELGFPTANVSTASEVLPPAGIYATWATTLDDGVRLAAATSLGTNPTFEATERLSLEAYLLDFDGDLYDRRLRVEFVDFLRPELRFDRVEDLVEQMHADVARTREILSKPENR